MQDTKVPKQKSFVIHRTKATVPDSSRNDLYLSSGEFTTPWHHIIQQNTSSLSMWIMYKIISMNPAVKSLVGYKFLTDQCRMIGGRPISSRNCIFKNPAREICLVHALILWRCRQTDRPLRTDATLPWHGTLQESQHLIHVRTSIRHDMLWRPLVVKAQSVALMSFNHPACS